MSNNTRDTTGNISYRDVCTYIKYDLIQFSSVQFSRSVMSDSLWPHELQHPSTPVHHQLLEFTQTHLHWVGDAIQPSHPLSSPCSPTFSLSQHQGIFQWVSSSHQVAKVLEFQLQHQSFQWIDHDACAQNSRECCTQNRSWLLMSLSSAISRPPLTHVATALPHVLSITPG